MDDLKRLERTCIGCLNQRSKDDLFRLVRGLDRHLAIDFQKKLPGRGIYVCSSSKHCLEVLLKKKGWIKNLGNDLEIPILEELIHQIWTYYQNQILLCLGLARKSQHLILGRETVSGRIDQGEVDIVIVASDVSLRMQQEIEKRCLQKNIQFFTFGNMEAFSHALGKSAPVGILALSAKSPSYQKMKQALAICIGFSARGS